MSDPIQTGPRQIKMTLRVLFMDGREETYEVWSYHVGPHELTIQPPEGTVHVPLANVRTWRQVWE